MSAEESKKHWITIAPSVLTAMAALIAALTGVYINVRGDKSTPPAQTAVVPVAVPVETVVPAVTVKSSSPVLKIVDLQLDRIRVDNDGSLGTTDWTFEIQNAERSLFSVPFKGLADNAGRNIVMPKETKLARANVTLASSGNMPEIIVRGWKQGWSGKADNPDVSGKAKINVDDDSFVIEAKSAKAGGPAFVLYFNTRLVQKQTGLIR